jgi:NADPH2:quinone reductase
MALAVRVHSQGGPEAMVLEEVAVPPPGQGEATVRHTAIGLNFIDVYQRSGHYKVQLPSGLGQEAAGVVTAIGPGVRELKVGDRVAYAHGAPGAYAEARNYPADRLVPVPEGVSDEVAAASLLKGLTAWYLVTRTFRVQQGQTVLVHAAAGGVGLLLCQWLRHLGVTVIGTVGTEAKAALARAAGCTHPFVLTDPTRSQLVEKVRALTSGAMVPVVYDSIGKETFDQSLQCLAPLGLMVLFGASSGPVPPFDLQRLAAGGSLYVTRPTLGTYIARREDLLAGSRELFGLIARGAIQVQVNQRYPLREVARAHRDLEERKTTGSTVLLPG